MKPKKMRPESLVGAEPSDVCQTPPEALLPILPLIGGVVWEAAAGPLQLLCKGLKEYTSSYVIASDIREAETYHADVTFQKNFFDFVVPHDIQITNPPYSLKYKWFERSMEVSPRFALLVPVETMAAQRFQKLVSKEDVSYVLFKSRVKFHMPTKGWNSNPQFPVMWVVRGFKLDKQVYYGV